MSTHCCHIEDDTHTMAFALCAGQRCFLPQEKKLATLGLMRTCVSHYTAASHARLGATATGVCTTAV